MLDRRVRKIGFDRIRTKGCLELNSLASSLEKSGRVDVCNMKLISREFEFERPLQPDVQSPLAPSAAGWDPYDVWCTRVRAQWPGATTVPDLSRRLRIVPDLVQVVPAPQSGQKPLRLRRGKKERAATAILPVVFVLLILFALTRELLGLFRIDVVSDVFGVMTPAARVIDVLLGVAALYCAFMISLRRRPRASGGG